MSGRLSLLLIPLAVLWVIPARAAAPGDGLLPPEPAWSGTSRSLTVAPDHPWVTVAERTGFERTASYEETLAWIERLERESAMVRLVVLGHSAEGRAVPMVVASADGAGTPEELAESGRPTLLVQAGIHAGEIDGKPAGMMLLRDLTVAGELEPLLEEVNLLFVPILNVDGHERVSAYSRINQRGPVNAGWRTNARNLNLNRDYAKLDSREMRAMVRALRRWRPDLYYDVHVTDGIDYQYDVTYGWNGPHAWSPATSRWLDDVLRPALDEALRSRGHVPGPLVFAVDRRDVEEGIWDWTASPRFSNGYGSASHLPTVLVENHSLKSFERRVLGTRVLLEATLRVLAVRGDGLRRATGEDRSARPDPVILDWEAGDDPTAEIRFLGVRSERYLSEVSGDLAVRWTGEPVTLEVPLRAADRAAARVSRPTAYWIPAAWSGVVEVLEAHGIELERIDRPRTVEVETYRFEEVETAEAPYEGRVRIDAVSGAEAGTRTFPAGSVRVPTDQPLGTLAVLLLEPGSPDSLFRWGFFNSALQRTEYAERYALEPLARRMLEREPGLREEFEQALAGDAELRNSVGARLRWFYRRSPWYDPRAFVYPVAREMAAR